MTTPLKSKKLKSSKIKDSSTSVSVKNVVESQSEYFDLMGTTDNGEEAWDYANDLEGVDLEIYK